MSPEPGSLILQLLRDTRATIETKADPASFGADLRSDMISLRADLTSNLKSLRKEPSEQIVGPRRAVVEYHLSVIGQGVIISDLEARLRRVEQHLDLPAMDRH